MRTMMKAGPLAAVAGAVLLATVAGVPAGAAEITVFRGSETTVVNTNAPQRGVQVLRGGMTTKKAAPPEGAGGQVVILIPAPLSGGGTVWMQTDDGLAACWLRGTGYVGESRIYCTER